MENQNSEKDYSAFLDQFNKLRLQKKYSNALVLAEERCNVLHMDERAIAQAADILTARDLLDQSSQMLLDLENVMSALSDVFARMGESSMRTIFEKDAQIKILTGWLKNVDRMKSHAANNK